MATEFTELGEKVLNRDEDVEQGLSAIDRFVMRIFNRLQRSIIFVTSRK